MNRLLVTGGAGFIGSNFIRMVLSEHPDCFIVNLDKLTYAGNLDNLTGFLDNPNHKFVKGDICDGSLIEKIIGQHRIDAIINFAAESHVDRSINEPKVFIETNVTGTLTLLEAARNKKLERFIQVSTDEVYGALGQPLPTCWLRRSGIPGVSNIISQDAPTTTGRTSSPRS
jgi:dTDP-glucose 4,6-dehydratase